MATETFSSGSKEPIDISEEVLTDPGEAWERRRKQWLSPTGADGTGRLAQRPINDAAFSERLKRLEELLNTSWGQPEAREISIGGLPSSSEHKRIGILRGESLSASSSGFLPAASTAKEHGNSSERDQINENGEECIEAAEEPDGGSVIRERGRDELERATEGILTAFRQGRPLKDPLPLSLVTKLLYRSWELDGTIPRNYDSRVTYDELPSELRKPAPPIGMVPPPPRLCEDVEAMGGVQIVDHDQSSKETERSDTPKFRIGRINGSSWRKEKDLASGSDVI